MIMCESCFPFLFTGIKGPELKSNWNKIWEMYLVETDPQQKAVFQTTLTSVTDPELMHKWVIYTQRPFWINDECARCPHRDWYLHFNGKEKTATPVCLSLTRSILLENLGNPENQAKILGNSDIFLKCNEFFLIDRTKRTCVGTYLLIFTHVDLSKMKLRGYVTFGIWRRIIKLGDLPLRKSVFKDRVVYTIISLYYRVVGTQCVSTHRRRVRLLHILEEESLENKFLWLFHSGSCRSLLLLLLLRILFLWSEKHFNFID